MVSTILGNLETIKVIKKQILETFNVAETRSLVLIFKHEKAIKSDGYDETKKISKSDFLLYLPAKREQKKASARTNKIGRARD